VSRRRPTPARPKQKSSADSAGAADGGVRHARALGGAGRISRNRGKRAGTNPRMIYEQFGSKSALYVAALESALSELRRRRTRARRRNISIGRRPCLQAVRLHETVTSSATVISVSLLRAENGTQGRAT